MNISVNGENIEIKSGSSIFDVLGELKLQERVMAVALNMKIVKESLWREQKLNDGDKLEFLDFVGGG